MPRLVNYDSHVSPGGIHTSADQWSLGPSVLDAMVYDRCKYGEVGKS